MLGWSNIEEKKRFPLVIISLLYSYPGPVLANAFQVSLCLLA